LFPELPPLLLLELPLLLPAFPLLLPLLPELFDDVLVYELPGSPPLLPLLSAMMTMVMIAATSNVETMIIVTMRPVFFFGLAAGALGAGVSFVGALLSASTLCSVVLSAGVMLSSGIKNLLMLYLSLTCLK
jgi:hypothetical protein